MAGHSYSNSNSVRPRTARLRHLSLDRPPSDDANVPEDVSVASRTLPGDADEDEEEDVFAFVPSTSHILTAAGISGGAHPKGPAEVRSPQNGRDWSFDIPRDEEDAWMEDMDSVNVDMNRLSVPMSIKDPLMDESRSEFASRDGLYPRLFNSRDGRPLAPGRHGDVRPAEKPFSWDEYDTVAADAMPSVHIGPRGSLHRSKSVSGYSDVPATVHSIEMDDLGDDTVRNRPDSRMVYEGEDASMLPTHTHNKNDAPAPPEDFVDTPGPSEIGEEEDSPYPEVRASVSNIDDPSMPVITLRMWFLALLLSSIGGGVNMFLSLRNPSPMLSPVILQLLAYFLGKFLALVLPIDVYRLPRWLGGFEFTLNPGAFNIKEHTLISIMVNITIAQAYAINFIMVTELPRFYGSLSPASFEFVFTLCAQVIGFGLSGFLHPFLVWPAKMLWPQTLLTSTILNTLHAEEEPMDKSISRLRWFIYVGLGACLYNFIPNFFMNALSQMCWTCWIAKDNIKLNIVTGVNGMGLTSLTFDWTQAAYLSSPLVTPWWAEVNIFAGFVVFMWILAPALYFSNTIQLAHFPFNAGQSFDRFGNPYNLRRVLEPGSFAFVQENYDNYSKMVLPNTFLLSYFAGFVALTAVLVHAVLNHGGDILRGLRVLPRPPDDIHAKLMRRYKAVPMWWYQWILVFCLIAILVVMEYADLNIRSGMVLLAIIIPAVYALPSGYIFALTGQMVGTNVVSDIIGGYMLTEHPKSFLLFKSLSVQTLIGCLSFTSDLKIGHYMKVPPRAVYAVQLVGTLVVVCVQLGVKRLLVKAVPDLCTPNQQYRLTCQGLNVYFTSSLVWGVIGPRRIFTESEYRPVLWGLFIGAILPIMVWLAKRKYPRSWVRLVSIPVFFTGASVLPAATAINFTSFIAVAFVFQYWLKRHNFRWWSKYNFVTANALDAGTILSELIIFFLIQLPSNDRWDIQWWGNSVMQDTADMLRTPLLPIPESGLDL